MSDEIPVGWILCPNCNGVGIVKRLPRSGEWWYRKRDGAVAVITDVWEHGVTYWMVTDLRYLYPISYSADTAGFVEHYSAAP